MDFEDLLNEQAKPQSLLKSTPQPLHQERKAVKKLAELNLEDELLEQYYTAQDLLENSKNEPLNQKAQTLNAITSILQAIIKAQQDLYNIERLKTLENTLIKVLQEFPEIKHKFLDAYEAELGKLWVH